MAPVFIRRGSAALVASILIDAGNWAYQRGIVLFCLTAAFFVYSFTISQAIQLYYQAFHYPEHVLAVNKGYKRQDRFPIHWYVLLFLSIALVFFAPVFPSPHSAAMAGTHQESEVDIELGKRYEEAKFYFNQLLTNHSLAQDRYNWSKGAQNFRRIYLSSPKSELAAPCLYMLGRIYNLMYKQFQRDTDLNESISYYRDTARLFSNHPLADDSYYALGLIYLADKNTPQQAADYFVRIVKYYPSGDMHPRAEDMLKQVSKDHDIALPMSMLENSPLGTLNSVLPVKYWSSDDYTRIVVKASGPVSYADSILPKTGNAPRRLYVDFHDSYIEPRYRAPVPIEDGLLKSIRTGQFSKDTVRVVLDIESIDSYKIYSLPDPFRVVIDVRGDSKKDSGKIQRIASSQSKRYPGQNPAGKTDRILVLKAKKKYFPGTTALPPYPLAESTLHSQEPLELSLAQQLGLGVKTIVLDPGHGGKDPGAVANGIMEKDIVLDLAMKLKPQLEQKLGCTVILTRGDDTFISLEERTAIANTKAADLFISLHVNAHRSSKVRGIETYFLNLTTNADAMQVAARENATSTHQMSDLQDILSDIMQNSKIEESSRLAQQVQNAIVDGDAGHSYRNIKNLGVKQAPFYVLIGAEMPSILLEAAFISNKEDVIHLKSSEFISALANDITLGVEAYVTGNMVGLTSSF